jgi:uncharacterized protein YfaS (alpha-2-macroglobulin family)
MAVYRTLEALEGADVELQAELQRAIADTLDRLYARQNPDGGWGWWRDWSNMHLTAYAVMGLAQAREAGITVREDSLEQAVAYVQGMLQTGLQTEVQSHYAFALYALSVADYDWPTGAASALYAARDSLDATGRAYLALALGQVDPSDTRIAAILESLRGEASVTATSAHWEAANSQFWNTNTLATSAVIAALARLAPDDVLLPQTVRWLITARRADHWETTYETAWAIMALTDYVLATGDVDAAYDWQAAFNGSLAYDSADGSADAGEAWETQFTMQGTPDIPALSKDMVNVLQISRGAGEGRLSYTAHLALAQPVEQVAPESRGITIQREYCVPAASTTNDLDACQR